MYYRNNLDINSELYDVKQFDSYDNYYFVIIDKRQVKYNYEEYQTKIKLHTDINLEEKLLNIWKNTSSDKFQSPLKIVWGHFYNDFNDLLYHPVMKDGTYIEKRFNKSPYSSILFINDVICKDKNYEKALNIYNFLKEHPEIYGLMDPDDTKCNYIYIDNAILYDDTQLLDANVEGDVVVLNNL